MSPDHPPVPRVRALVKQGKIAGQIVAASGQVADLPQQVVQAANGWLEAKRQEIVKAEAAYQALKQMGANRPRLARLRSRIRFLRHFMTALEAGYVPIPRFESQEVDINVDELPAEVLVALASARALKIFDEVRFVPGTLPESRPGIHHVDTIRGRTWTRKRLAARDPLVIGIIRTPEHRVQDPTVTWRQLIVVPSREETFLIGWWRPEDEHDWTMF